MAEVQTSTESGEMVQKFIELVMMQAQNAAFALGQIPHPETGEAPVNLELARIFIDHLVVLRVKTRNNLSPDETAILNNTISNLQMAYVEVAKSLDSPSGDAPAAEPAEPADYEEPAASIPAPEPPPVAAAPEPAPEESRKKFTKSYGS